MTSVTKYSELMANKSTKVHSVTFTLRNFVVTTVTLS